MEEFIAHEVKQMEQWLSLAELLGGHISMMQLLYQFAPAKAERI